MKSCERAGFSNGDELGTERRRRRKVLAGQKLMRVSLPVAQRSIVEARIARNEIHRLVLGHMPRGAADDARQLPLDAMVVETDSPYGPPQSRRGQRNEPACVSEAVAKIAELRDEPIERVAEATTENALCLFAQAIQEPAAGAATRRSA
jgi:hypothetical protein